MAGSRRLLVRLAGLVLCTVLTMETGMTVKAGGDSNYLDSLSGGVAAILDPGAAMSTESVKATVKKSGVSKEEKSTRVMANVKQSLTIRSEAKDDGEQLGKLYKDCGGTILERKDGWTRLQSGNLIGWAKDKYLLFDEDAEALANDVGRLVAYMNDVTRIRKDADAKAGMLGLLPKGELVEVLSEEEDGWIRIDYEGNDGYVPAECVTLDFQIDTGETNAEIKARQAAEKEARRHVNYGEYTTDADTTLLLAALIQCEAGGESYEGKVAVGAVVMNRVRSAAYPDTIHGVIYASGQFTPAMNGKVNRVYESGRIMESCIEAAKEALSGVSNVGDLTHFRRNNGREGLVIGNHVFY